MRIAPYSSYMIYHIVLFSFLYVLQPAGWSCETSQWASSDCRCKQTFLSSMYSKGVRSKKVKRRNLAFVQRLLIDPLLPTKILYFSRVLAYSALRLTATMGPNPFWNCLMFFLINLQIWLPEASKFLALGVKELFGMTNHMKSDFFQNRNCFWPYWATLECSDNFLLQRVAINLKWESSERAIHRRQIITEPE